MGDLADKVWLLAALVAVIGMLALLHVVAVSVENEVRAHDLKISVNRVRKEQIARLREKAEAAQARFAKAHGAVVGEVELVEEERPAKSDAA